MKKRIAVLAILALVAAGAFAAPQFTLSTGGGLIINPSFNNGVKSSRWNSSIDITTLTVGGYGFFDFTYGEFALWFGYGMTKASGTGYGVDLLGGRSYTAHGMDIGFSLVGKFPFTLGSKVKLFPMFGFDYNAVVSRSLEGESLNDPSSLSQFGLLLGAGVDYNLTSRLYLRGQALFQIRFPSRDSNNFATDNPGYGITTKAGFGPVIKLAVGYTFMGAK